MILHYWTNLTKKIDFNSESLRTGEAPSFNGNFYKFIDKKIIIYMFTLFIYKSNFFFILYINI